MGRFAQACPELRVREIAGIANTASAITRKIACKPGMAAAHGESRTNSGLARMAFCEPWGSSAMQRRCLCVRLLDTAARSFGAPFAAWVCAAWPCGRSPVMTGNRSPRRADQTAGTGRGTKRPARAAGYGKSPITAERLSCCTMAMPADVRADRRHVLAALEYWLPRWRDVPAFEFVTMNSLAGASSPRTSPTG